MLRFGIVGICATVTHVVIVLSMVEGGFAGPFWANVAAFTGAVFVSYFGNHGWTFRLSGGHATHFSRFLPVALTGLALNQGIVYLVVRILGLDYRIALGLVVSVVPTITFTLSRQWAFRHASGRPVQDL